MLTIPAEYATKCDHPGTVDSLAYGDKNVLLYTPKAPARRILYLIHGGGGNERSFFRPAFLNMVDHMIDRGTLEPLYIVSPCFYDPKETDKTPASSGIAVKKFCTELREEIIPLIEGRIGQTFERENRAISGFSMGGVTTWYAFLQALDLFYWFLPLSGDCWICGETGGGKYPEQTARELISALIRQGAPDFRIHAITGSKDIAFPNLDAQIRAMERYPDIFGEKLKYEVLENGVHDYETIFRYLYNALPLLFGDGKGPKRYEAVRMNENSWRIEDNGVRFFLLTGTDKALLIDTGMKINNAKDIAAELTSLPLSLLNTHADRDHIGSNEQFEAFYMHPAEEPLYRRSGKPGKIIPVVEGDTIDLGCRELKIIELPGHTPGSIAVLDGKNRVLISGDPIQENGRIFMFGNHRNMKDYIRSLERLEKRKDEFDEIWPSHANIPVSPALIRKLRDGAQDILAGKIPGKAVELHGNRIVAYDLGFDVLLCDP